MQRRKQLLLFGIGIIFGMTLKTIAINSFTIGSLDYTVSHAPASIDLNVIEKKALSNGSMSEFQSDTGKTCPLTQ